MKIFIAGHRGLVGSAIARHIEEKTSHTWIGQTRDQLNLLDKSSVEKFVKVEKPDSIIIAAAKVGGIKANADYPVEFLSENLQIQNNLINSAFEANVKRVVFLGSSCIYPKLSPQPIKEKYLLTGALEPTNEPYAIAKLAGLKLIQAYRKEFQKNWISLMPTNVYGPRDNFDPDSSHVLPGLIRKFHDAKSNNRKSVALWGTGSPRREFLYSEDLADAVIFLLENYDSDIPINVGTGLDIEIADLADLVARIVGYKGKISWNNTMPDGTPRKLLDISLLKSLGWTPKTELSYGIEKTYHWFLKNMVHHSGNFSNIDSR